VINRQLSGGFGKPPLTASEKYRVWYRLMKTAKVRPFIRFWKTVTRRVRKIPRLIPVSKNRIDGLTTVNEENRPKPRFHTPRITAVFLNFFFRGLNKP